MERQYIEEHAAAENTRRSLLADLALRDEENRALQLRLAVLEATLSEPYSTSSSVENNNINDNDSDVIEEEHSLISRPAMCAVLVETEEEPENSLHSLMSDQDTVAVDFLSQSPPRPPIKLTFPVVILRTLALAMKYLQVMVNVIKTAFVRGVHSIKDNLQRISVFSVSYIAWVFSVLIVKAKFEDSFHTEDPPQKTTPTDTLSRQ